MKKTLIALAAVAATGAAFAQSSVTLSGKLRFAYEGTSSNTGAVKTTANGLKVTDGNFTLTATEDLGAGMKMTAVMDVKSRGRDTAIEGRDAYLKLDGGFGSVMIGSIEAGNGIIGLGGAGAPVYGMDGPVIAAASNVDILKYTTPAMGGFTFSVNTTDATATLGQESTYTKQDSVGAALNYAAGPIAAAVDYTDYGANSAPAPLADNRWRLSGSYDLGVAKIGAGYERKELVGGVTSKDTILGVKVPVGAVTLGFNYATNKTDGQVRVKGYDLGAQYDLSKRTYVAFHYESVDNKNAAGAVADGNKNSKWRVQLSHAF